MQIKNEFPPNYQEIKNKFQNLEKSKPIFCYGDIIYNPFNLEVTYDLQVHEEVHSKQQGLYPEIWWNKYLNDDEFRLYQEIEAYGEQYKLATTKATGKLLEWVLDKTAEALSSELYGKLLTFNEAKCKIKNYTKYN